MSKPADDELARRVAQIVADFLADSVAAHRRRVALRLGLREPPDPAGCDHRDFDVLRKWCNGCGATLLELRRAGR